MSSFDERGDCASSPCEPSFDSDLIVVGGGVAGLAVALGARGKRVTLLSKVPVSLQGAGGSSVWAQGGVAAAVGADDSPALHAEDTLAAGAGLSVPRVVRVLTEEGPEKVFDLIALGAQFDRADDGGLALGREAAHSKRRVLHANGDATGAEIVRAMMAAVQATPRIRVVGSVEVVDLALAGDPGAGRVCGVVGISETGARQVYRAPAVVLATGGLGHLFAYTTNPPENTGDGLALAARAGARLVDLEFVQFHPTALDSGADPMPLLTEALRGEGAVLVDDGGDRFMLAEHELAELAPRDIVARAIWRKKADGHEVFLDAREVVGEAFPERFPTVFALCQAHGLDPRRELMPVSPATHFHMGGIATDIRGRTSLEGLWACGEVASTGAHGANRLASNSLLEGLVYGARVAVDIESCAGAGESSSGKTFRWAGEGAAGGSTLAAEEEEAKVQELRKLMWKEAGLVRSAASLERAGKGLKRLGWWVTSASPRLRNLHTVAQLVSQAASRRLESRGGHFRTDFPQPDPAWKRRLFVTLEDGLLREVPAWPESSPALAATSGEVAR